MKEQTSHTKLKLWFGLIIGFVGLIGLIVGTEPEPQAALVEQWPVRVDLTVVKQDTAVPIDHAVGRLKPARRAMLNFEVPGRIVLRHTEPGTRVAKGQPIALMADGDARDRLDEAEAQFLLEKEAVQRDRELLRLAERNTVLQRAEVERLMALKAKALTSMSQLDAARQALIQLQADEARLQHAVRTAAARLALRETQRNKALRDLERHTLKAPFAGTVNRVEVDIGDYVSIDQPIAEIVDLDLLDLYVEVRGVTVADLELGQTLTITVDNKKYPARLHAIQHDPDPATYTHALRIRLSDRRARPGTLAAIELPRAPINDALMVPVTAILSVDGEAFVFHYIDGILQRSAVVLGPRVGDMQVILAGLNDGDRIVTRDISGLSDGQRVEVSVGVS